MRYRENALLFLLALLLVAAITVAQTQKPSGVADFISVDAPVFVLDHVRVIDGTGAPAKEEQAVAIVDRKIQFIGSEASALIPEGAQRIDRSGYTVIPGIVGMHNHLYYIDSYAVQVVGGKIGEPGLFIAEIPYTAPRLYLAAGVTTMRTTGSLEPYTDLKVKSRIDANLPANHHFVQPIWLWQPHSYPAKPPLHRQRHVQRSSMYERSKRRLS